MRSSQVDIESPCHESWDAMEGGEARRFCGVCEKHVHDLSAMRQDEAAELLRASAGERLCVRYTAEADGTLRFRDLVPRSLLTRKLLRTAFAASMLAACTPHGDDLPRGLGEALIESQQANVEATPGGGCNYTTGPFTTFHLPPGHALCQNAGPVTAIVTTPPVEPPALPVLMGEMAPIDSPPQVVDPPAMAKMGEAVAVPEAKDPFVPCDPNPGYVPPPPGPPPKPASRPLMGDIAVEAPTMEPPPAPPDDAGEAAKPGDPRTGAFRKMGIRRPFK